MIESRKPGDFVTVMSDYLDRISIDGYSIIPNLWDEETVRHLQLSVESFSESSATRSKNGQSYGIRNLLNVIPTIRSLARHECIRALIDPVVGPEAKPVRGIFFDKTSDANWKVAWHQDLTISVKRKIDVAGFSAWSEKAGICHVQPDVAVLENMLTLRIYLDDSDAENGALRVIPGSHREGRLNQHRIDEFKVTETAVTCTVPRGGVLVMRPLLLHASSMSKNPYHRRVIHLEFSSHKLPGGLEWFGS